MYVIYIPPLFSFMEDSIFSLKQRNNKLKEKTVGDLITKFDHFRQVPDTGNIIIHPGLNHGFIELTEEFVNDLKKNLVLRIALVSTGIDELNPIEKFAIMMLEDAY